MCHSYYYSTWWRSVNECFTTIAPCISTPTNHFKTCPNTFNRPFFTKYQNYSLPFQNPFLPRILRQNRILLHPITSLHAPNQTDHHSDGETEERRVVEECRAIVYVFSIKAHRIAPCRRLHSDLHPHDSCTEASTVKKHDGKPEMVSRVIWCQRLWKRHGVL